MTKHRKPEDWTQDILDAAGDILDQDGYANLTMDAVASRTNLSKGGIYRFFESKQQLVLSLLDHSYYRAIDFHIDEVVALNLPIDETLVRVIVDRPAANPTRMQRDDRIWLQIIPQAVWDPLLAAYFQGLTTQYESKCFDLAIALLKRENVKLTQPTLLAIHDAVQMGLILRDGLVVRHSVLSALTETTNVARRYVRMMVKQILGDLHNVQSA